MSYTAKSLEEIATLFDTLANEADASSKRMTSTQVAASISGEAHAFRAAADILRRTTLTEPCHMEKPSEVSAAECEANAVLIAAAPALLATVNAAADTFADFALMFKVLSKPLMVESCRIAEESMRAAIARATAPTTEGAK